MAYASKNLKLVAGETWLPDTPCIWSYASADAIATVRVDGYMSDAKYRGMKVGDLVYVYDSATPTAQLCLVITVAETGADLANGTSISVTNSD